MFRYLLALAFILCSSTSFAQNITVIQPQDIISLSAEDENLISISIEEDSLFSADLDLLGVKDKKGVYSIVFLPRNSNKVIITIAKSYKADKYILTVLSFVKEKLFITSYHYEGRRGWDDYTFDYRSDGAYSWTRERTWSTQTIIVDGFMITSSGFHPDRYPWKGRIGIRKGRTVHTERVFPEKEATILFKLN